MEPLFDDNNEYDKYNNNNKGNYSIDDKWEEEKIYGYNKTISIMFRM